MDRRYINIYLLLLPTTPLLSPPNPHHHHHHLFALLKKKSFNLQVNSEETLPEYACMVNQVVIKADFSAVVFSLFSIYISRLWTNMSRNSLNFNEFVK